METMLKTKPDLEPCYTVGEVAEAWRCGVNTVYGLIYDGKLAAFALNPGAKTRKNWRIRRSLVDAFGKRDRR
jgi:excisionase family DNA binding protein